MDDPNERRELRDLFARRWGALLKWLALLVVGIAVVVILVSIGGDDGFGQLDADNPTRTYFLVFFLVAADAVVPIFPGETTLNAASTFAADGDLELVGTRESARRSTSSTGAPRSYSSSGAMSRGFAS